MHARAVSSHCVAALMAMFVGAAALAQNTTVFRCTAGGKVTLQQRPCDEGADTQRIDVAPGNVIQAPTLPPVKAVAPAPSQPAPSPNARTALDPAAELCLAHLRGFLRDPRSATVRSISRDGRVLFVELHAKNAIGEMVSRRAACEMVNGSVDAGWTKIQLERLGWFRPLAVFSGPGARREARQQELNDIEAR